MVKKGSKPSPPRGRPRSFDRDVALDRAVEMFWAHGYEGVDVERLAEAVGVTKPSIYNAFGDKAALFFKAVQRYAQTHGAIAFAAFEKEGDIARAVQNFFTAFITATTSQDGRTGCLMARAAMAGGTENGPEIRAFIALKTAAGADVFARRFEKEMALGHLSNTISAHARGRLVMDLVQGLTLRARVGVPRKQLIEDSRTYVPLVLR